MRREGVQLLARARQGDVLARCEVGRCYLLGLMGFPQHVPTGVEYLLHDSVAASPQAARILAECLAMEDLLTLGLHDALGRAARAGSRIAQVRHAVWTLLRGQGDADAREGFAAAAAAGHDGARAAVDAMAASSREDEVRVVLEALTASADIDGRVVSRIAAQQALDEGRLELLVDCLRAALALSDGLDAVLSELVARAALLAEAQGRIVHGLPGAALRDSLERQALQGDRAATFLFGRGLCGIACPPLPDEVFAAHANMRKGAAFLLRAADAGCDAAWLHLYRLHADHRLSVANPQLARFFLEKAALRGQTEAQRKLGALLLREAASLSDSEQAIHWLHQAFEQGDPLAGTLLRSLVLPLGGTAEEAMRGIEQMRAVDPWLATRLALSRAFGLTKLEALCVDPVDGLRPWGLVVGRNPFISQVRLSAPRAVPAITGEASQTAQRAAGFFGQLRGEGAPAEGDLRARSLRQRRLFERLGLDEAWYFSDATSMELESLRLGAKWAYRARQPLRQALAA